MSENWKSKRGPTFKVEWPKVLGKIQKDWLLRLWLDYASHVNEKGIAFLGEKGIKQRTGLWIITIREGIKILEGLGLMKKHETRLTKAGNEITDYFVKHVQLWDPKKDPENGMILPLFNMAANGFLKKPVQHWYKTPRKKREQRYAKEQAFIALCWLLACAETETIPYDIVQPKVSDFLSVHDLLADKLDISHRQVRRYIALFLDSKVIQEVKEPMMFDERGYRIRRYQFTENFVYDWLRLPEKEELDEEGKAVLAAQQHLDDR